MARRLRDSVVVITGASSGIGRATALRFASKGATVVLNARTESELRELASACERLGSRPLVLPADVTDEAAMKDLAQLAAGAFRRIDVWVNNAAVSLFSLFEESPPEAFRQVIETNLFGYVHGARAALPYFHQQGGGVLINVSSVFGTMGAPYLSAYVTSKYAIRGLSECLRQESRDSNIRVVTILPASIEPPVLSQAAHATDRALPPLEPLYPADRVARAIVRSAVRPKREVYVGSTRRRRQFLRPLTLPVRAPLSPARPSPAPGNLLAPVPPVVASGRWRDATYVRKGLLLGLLAVPVLLGWRWLAQGRGLFF
ncbi:SDR family NAD(P)-dependent oxidoreductase [Hyalangium sp.]|uniref:SDR family NAD(P)-dependent oxidoreductase n=1 Tax=Hyalangium sp. TaxID=2028555 RepID=UPI002D509EDE|nr:SDR family NAD(P)-dependent oxidoreductase [Hyalangium sp.]HYH98157.1 SDR family NAD(P)-dependent oxidoreductase [Hyalangium sp.]